MDPAQADIGRLIKLVRYCFQRLKTLGDELHADLGMTSSLRAILEWLAEHDEQTVPRIAAAKSVSRQHIQKHTDMLVESGHVEFKPNARHKRSPFVLLTKKGAAVIKEMKQREARIIAEIAAAVNTKQTAQTISWLQRFTDEVSKHIRDHGEADN